MSEEFLPMLESDLDEVVICEQAAARSPWSRGNFADALAAGNSGWILRSGGVLVAQAVFMSVLDEAHLLILSVLPECQGRGHGRRMLEWIWSRARLAGAHSIFLEVRASNARAIALYESLGFALIGRRKAYYATEDHGREDALVMSAVL
ncbi:ribosomal protein S18-alanine N-acetyltransferase [Uliginosibacterium paludis]|uniref:[Ribosomal protein bS18]-alanine N-acetyltransferase n=1 Tax=Uliginosibacterium paludis TaxID=1615952 RepID=A0ABV2CUC8_9RHOO